MSVRHLQEWLANTPSALGEEFTDYSKRVLLGFDGTRDRLDLLALDKEGALVVIENKLDDSGSDVVGQVLKYVAYCSSLTKIRCCAHLPRLLENSRINKKMPVK